MTNSGKDTEELGKASYRVLHANYLKEQVKEPLEKEIQLLYDQGEILHECIDTILLLIFTHIDLLGYLYKGKNKSIYAVEFIRSYLGKVDNRYMQVGGLLYDALRHGYVHLGTPKRILLNDKKVLDFLFTFGKKQEYLKVNKVREREQGSVEIYRLLVEVTQLSRDLLSAIDLYAEDISHNQDLSDSFWENIVKRREPETEAHLKKVRANIFSSQTLIIFESR